MAGLIICGVDDSGSAKGAARVARGLSSKLGLGLMFVRVVEERAPKKEVSHGCRVRASDHRRRPRRRARAIKAYREAGG